MLLLGFDGKVIDETHPIVHQIRSGQIGGVILFDYDFQKKTFDKNIESPEQVKALTYQLQQTAKSFRPPDGHKQLPLFISVDYEGGQVNRLKSNYGFPEAISAEKIATLSDELAHHYAVQMAETLRRTGFNLNFAPVLDLNTNKHNPVIGQLQRSYSSDPEVVAFYSNIFSDAFHDRGVYCAYKHFPGHGSSEEDSHLGFVDVTSRWHKKELLPYKLVLKNPKHCPMVMSAHIVNRQLDVSGLPATLSRPILTDLLRKKLKFKGVIVTDDLQMQAITDNYRLDEAVTKAIQAGADILVFGNQLTGQKQDPQEVIDLVIEKIRQGDIKAKRIHQSYQRIIKLKQGIQ